MDAYECKYTSCFLELCRLHRIARSQIASLEEHFSQHGMSALDIHSTSLADTAARMASTAKELSDASLDAVFGSEDEPVELGEPVMAIASDGVGIRAPREDLDDFAANCPDDVHVRFYDANGNETGGSFYV